MTTPEPTTTNTTDPANAAAGTAQDAARAATLLDAGAILSAGAAKGDDVDSLTARTYTHPGLGDRRIVRLIPGTLGDAEDLALDFLGLTRDGDAPEVGQVRRETLGFPAWALVNDPDNGHHALALVRDIERLDRQARTKPGAAKDGFDALGTKLGRAVPHFLPTFYEQAARIFLAHENTTYAATFFGKAREAERVHNLAVEEARLRAVFLEFAFAGALTAKALKEYAKDLTRRLEPAAAWGEFRQLCVERCAAGMPPYAGLAEDARAMIKAVDGGADAQSAAERALLADLLPSPAIVHAPLSFWKAFAKPLAALAGEEPAIRGRLLEIFPTPTAGDAQVVDAYWIKLLLAAGADTPLTTPGALESGGAAAWLVRWARHISRGWRDRPRDIATLELAARMAPAVIADAIPLDFFGGAWHGQASPDLIDVCLAHGMPMVDPKPENAVELGRWFNDSAAGRRDLVAFGADARYSVLLRPAVGQLGDENGARDVAAAAEHPVLRVAMRDWLAERTDELVTQSGLPGAHTALNRIMPFRSVAAAVNPDAVARVHAFAVAPVLARTLRTGIVDELGWPALDEAMNVLGVVPESATPGLSDTDKRDADKRPDFRVAEAWPALILATTTKAVVVGPEGILLEHDLRIPDKLSSSYPPKFRYVDGDLFVTWWAESEYKAYWSSRPAETFEPTGEIPGRWGDESPVVSLPHPQGGRVTGGRVLHAGDTELPKRLPVLSDGTGHWLLSWHEHPWRWVEYDPATGETGRASLPGPLAAAVADGGSLSAGNCELLPLQPGLETSPFGTDGTLLGRWVRYDDNSATATTLDGHSVTMASADLASGRYGRRKMPIGGLRLPGARPTIVADDDSLYVYDGSAPLGSVRTTTSGGDHAGGTPLVTPLAFWHALRPRDAASSEALRAVADADAEALLAGEAEAYAAELAALDPTSSVAIVQPDPVPLVAVSGALPAVTHPGIAAGVAGITRVAARLTRRLALFGTAPTVTHEDVEDYRPENGQDGVIQEAISGLVAPRSVSYGRSSGTWATLNQMRAVAALLRSPEQDAEDSGAEGDASPADTWTSTDVRIPHNSVDWTAALGHAATLLARAASPITRDEHRAAIGLFVEDLADPAFRQQGHLRRVILGAERQTASRVGQVLRRGDRVVVITHQAAWGENQRVHWMALDFDPSGAFGAVADFTTQEELPVETPDDPDRLAELLGLIRESGPIGWFADTVAAFAEATGTRRTEAALFLAGLPDTDGSLDAEQRKVLGIKAAEAAAARSKLNSVDVGVRSRVLTASIPSEAAAWWTAGPDGAAAAAEWNRHVGRAVRLPEDVAVDAAAAKVPEAQIELVLNPEASPALTRRTVQRLDANRSLVADDHEAIPQAGTLSGVVRALTWLAYRLPYGDPLRPALPKALAALRERLTDPELLLDFGLSWAERGGYTSIALRAAEGMPETGGEDADGLVRIGEKIVLAPWYHNENVLIRVGKLTGPDDPDLMRVVAMSGEQKSWLVRSLKAVLDTPLGLLVAAGVDGPVGYAQDPSWSVPDLVAEAAKTFDIESDAATLYLQLLALPDPTDRNVARWTGWKPARLKAARAALAATDLVVTAKRARASRSLFLPGGWHEFRTALPLEVWKGELFPVQDGALLVPDRPVVDLFHAAWQRVTAGDAPGFEQLETRTARRGRRR